MTVQCVTDLDGKPVVRPMTPDAVRERAKFLGIERFGVVSFMLFPQPDKSDQKADSEMKQDPAEVVAKN